MDSCADDEGLLTQAEEDKEKCKQKGRCGAVGVRLPSAYNQEVKKWKENLPTLSGQKF